MNVSAELNSAAEMLASAGVAEFRREASSLLVFVLQKDTTFLVAHPEYELTGTETAAYQGVIGRRANREPFQYIVGRREFYGLDFDVTPDVLIPRPETEVLVEAAIKELNTLWSPVFCEVGVGSGCISVSILFNVPNATSVGTDISKKAIAVAGGNAKKHHVDARITLSEGDVFEGLSGAFDLIVSNPPYIPNDHIDTLQAEVGRFEPHTALFGGSDGLDIIKRIIAEAPKFLKPNGFLLIEIGFDQSTSVKELCDRGVWENVEFLPDLQGVPRTLKARLRN